MEKEIIIKALECCITDSCISCPYYDVGVYSQCAPTMLENALALIKELTEDNQAKDETITNLIATIKDVQADTVRKMQERIKASGYVESTITGYRYAVVELAEIDQIAKEMLEGNDDND